MFVCKGLAEATDPLTKYSPTRKLGNVRQRVFLKDF